MVVFLDFDGVVNTPYWRKYNNKLRCRYAHPSDGFVNNFQAICWLNELYEKHPYNIVVTSSWREIFDNPLKGCSRCLYKGGLNPEIGVIGVLDSGIQRPTLINKWLEEHPEVKEYIIIDDEDYYTPEGLKEYNTPNWMEMKERFILTDSNFGFGIKDTNRFEEIIKHMEEEKNVIM